MAAFAATLLPAGLVLAQLPFSLDTTYRTTISDQNVNDMILLQDGKLYLSGQIRWPGEVAFKGGVRLLNDGTRDLAYTAYFGQGRVMTWQNGLFYVKVGASPRRLLPDATLDPTFIGPNSSPYYYSSVSGGDYHVFEDGRVLVTGQHNLSDTVRGFTGLHHVVFFQNTGYLDTTRTHRKAVGTIWRVKAQADGRILCGGAVSQYANTPVPPVFRIHPDGALDSSFQSVTTWGNTFIYNFIPLPDGRFYQTGSYGTSATGSDTLCIARFMPDGTLDPSFDPPNFNLGALPGFLSVRGCLILNDGRLLVHGRFRTVNGASRKSICLLDSTGSLLSGFEDEGVGTYTFQGVTNANVNAVAIDSINNHLYISGTYNGYNDGTTNDPLQRFVSRLHLGDPLTVGVSQPVPAEPGHLHLFPNPASTQVTLELEEVPDGSEVQLRDALGRMLFRERLTGHYHNLQTHALSSGVYVVELLVKGIRVGSAKLVVE